MQEKMKAQDCSRKISVVSAKEKGDGEAEDEKFVMPENINEILLTTHNRKHRQEILKSVKAMTNYEVIGRLLKLMTPMPSEMARITACSICISPRKRCGGPSRASRRCSGSTSSGRAWRWSSRSDLKRRNKQVSL